MISCHEYNTTKIEWKKSLLADSIFCLFLLNKLPPMNNNESLKIAPEPIVSVEIKEELLACAEERGQVVVHCSFTADDQECCIRIWKSTYLIAHDVEHQSELLQSFNITMSPAWTVVDPFDTQEFTLIFAGLPKDCQSFDLVESIPEPLPFHVRNIKRKPNDVYRITLA
jgi:hypothetical protein